MAPQACPGLSSITFILKVAQPRMSEDDNLLQLGDRIRLSALGESRFLRAKKKSGIVIGFGYSGNGIRVNEKEAAPRLGVKAGSETIMTSPTSTRAPDGAVVFTHRPELVDLRAEATQGAH